MATLLPFAASQQKAGISYTPQVGSSLPFAASQQQVKTQPTVAGAKTQVQISGLSPTTPKNVQATVTKNLIAKPVNQTYKLPSGIKLDLVPTQPASSAQMTVTPKSIEQQKKVDQKITKVANTVTQNATKFFPETSKQFSGLEIDPLSLKEDPKKALTDAWDGVTTSVKEESKRISELFKSKSISEGIGKGLESVTGGVDVIFRTAIPITTLFTAANHIPVLGTVSKLITLPFTFLGEAGADIGKEGVNRLNIPEKDKENLRQGVGEIFSLAAQLAAGKVMMGAKRTELIKKYGLQDALTIEAKAKEMAKTQQSTLEEGKTYTPQEIIGKVVDSPLEKTPEGKILIQAAAQAQQEGKSIQLNSETKIQGTGTSVPSEKPIVTGETPSKIAQSIQRKAIEDKLTKGFEGLAGYDKITIKEQAAKAAEVIKDPEKAGRIIRGEEELPQGLRGTALITAAEDYIKKTGDAKLAHDLANSHLVSETSAAAQELRLAAEREPDSLALKLRELRQAKEEAIKKRTGKNIQKAVKSEVDKIKFEVRKSAPKKEDWSSFLTSIQC